jgi:hypothetical protein
VRIIQLQRTALAQHPSRTQAALALQYTYVCLMCRHANNECPESSCMHAEGHQAVKTKVPTDRSTRVMRSRGLPRYHNTVHQGVNISNVGTLCSEKNFRSDTQLPRWHDMLCFQNPGRQLFQGMACTAVEQAVADDPAMVLVPQASPGVIHSQPAAASPVAAVGPNTLA